MKITVKKSIIVQPSEDTPSGRMWLSNLDLIFGNFHVPVLYMFKPDGSSNFFDVKILKEALSKVLVPFYPIAGRLAHDESGRIEINCNGEGVLFVEADADCPMSDFNDFTPRCKYMELVPQVDCSAEISSFPFLLIQVTKFCCGGVCLGIGSHHQVLDGQSATHFTNSWSETARGLTINTPPIHERSLLRARDPPIHEFHHIEYLPNPKFKPNSEGTLSAAIFKLPVEFVNTLKAKVMNNKETNVKYTTFEILSAHIWRCTSKSRNLSDDQANMLKIPVDGRNRLDPQLPNGYIGNVVFHATSVVSTGELISESLTKTVERIHKALNQMKNDYLRSAIDFLEQNGLQIALPTLYVNSLVRLPIACTNFGWGRTTFMRHAGGKEGVSVLLPSYKEDENGGLSLFVCLLEEDIRQLKKILYALE